MNIFSYIIAHDTGFAPNPFWDCCTLACCKPAIRRTAKKGDLIVGLTPKAQGNKVVYVMRVTSKLTFTEYWKHPGFQRKKPTSKRDDAKADCGDNIYRPLANGKWRQLASKHSNDDGSEDEKSKRKDLSGEYVLVADDFVYFGSSAMSLPRQFRSLIVGRSHRRLSSSNDERLITAFSRWFDRQKKGRQGMPAKWMVKSSCSPRKHKPARRSQPPPPPP